MAIRIMPYRPNVHCFGQGTGAPWETCRDLIDGMPVGGERRRFVPEGMGEGGVGDVVVPWRRTTGARRCEIVCLS